MLQLKEYQQKIADENIPVEILDKLNQFGTTLNQISEKYEEIKDFLKAYPDVQLSYNDIVASQIDFADLAKELANNQGIKDLVRKMGRSYISEEMKKHQHVPKVSQSEIYGTHKSDDLMRLLPSELGNIDDEDLQILFYVHLLEKGLQTYELQGMAFENEEQVKKSKNGLGLLLRVWILQAA